MLLRPAGVTIMLWPNARMMPCRQPSNSESLLLCPVYNNSARRDMQQIESQCILELLHALI